MKQKTKKEIALDFLVLASEGNARDAFEMYASEDFRHHNVYFKGDAESLISAMEENARNAPDKKLEIKRSLEDGDLVAVHSLVRLTLTDPGTALIHIFRFEDDKIVEVWDFGQAVPEVMINENGMF